MSTQHNRLLKVCFCGRPNVGKSSLFNRLSGKKHALVLDEPGVTRDVYRKEVDWDGVKLELADLAGLEEWTGGNRLKSNQSSKQTLKELATRAAIEYLKTADLVLFVVDSRQSLTPLDEDLARLVRSYSKNVILVLSKVEGRAEEDGQIEASRLGWGTSIATSAEHNTGITTLKEKIIEVLGDKLNEKKDEITEGSETSTEDASLKRPIRIGVYGKPNVGKSTLVNMLLGEDRMITSSIAGTTVDSIDTDFVHNGKLYRIVDTAGIRKKSKTEKGVEVLSVVAALKSIREIDVALFLIDGYEGISDQDEKVAGEIVKAGKPIALMVNKWDKCKTKKEDYAERIRKTLGFLDYAPILFISAATGEGIDALWGMIDEMITQRTTVASTGELNRFLELVEGANNPTGVRLYYASQTGKNPPTITILVSDPKKVHFAFERYLKNELRSRYGWMGSPIQLSFKARKRSPSKKSRGESRA